MKILFVLFSLDAGGVTAVTDTLAVEMVKMGHDVQYVSMLGQPTGHEPVSNVISFGYKTLNLKVFFLSFVRLWKFFVDNRDIDAVIVASAYPGIITTVAARLAFHKAKVLINFHTHVSAFAAIQPFTRKFLLSLGRIVLPFADICANVSKITAKDAADYFGLKRVATLHNPLKPYQKSENLEQHPPHPWLNNPDIFPIIAAGRLTDVKDFPLMFKSLLELKNMDARYKLIILGKGELESELKALAYDLNLEDDIHFGGHVSNQRDYMALGRFLWLTSKFEGFNMVLLEALSAGIPCIATNYPTGIHEALDNGKYGLLINSRDPEMIAQQTYMFDQQPKHPPEFYQQRIEEFTPEVVTERYLKLLSS